MNWIPLTLPLLLVLLITAMAVYALLKVARDRRIGGFDAQARSIFDDREPEGVQTDFFPRRRPARSGTAASAPRHQS